MTLRSKLDKYPGVKKVIKPLLRPYRKKLDRKQQEIYLDWLRENEKTRKTPILEELSRQPKVSIVVPLYNTPEAFFWEMANSVLDQSYPNWELVLVDDASPNALTRENAKKLARQDERVKVILSDSNLHISGATNLGVGAATGEYIALLDHDDILHRDALLFVVGAINEKYDLQFIYTDESKLDEKGTPYQPFLKPDWNFDLLRSVNYITHFCVISKELYTSTGGEDGEYNGTQDWELFLRATRLLSSAQIHHVPEILYFWRVHKHSTAADIDAKPYVIEAQRRALETDIAARGVSANAVRDPEYGAQWQMQYILPQTSHVRLISEEDIPAALDTNTKKVVFCVYRNQVDKQEYKQSINIAAANALRKDTGVVIPRLNDETNVMQNLGTIISTVQLNLISNLSRRSFTRHIYETAQYNVGTPLSTDCIYVEADKLRKLTREELASVDEIVAGLSRQGYAPTYIPYY